MQKTLISRDSKGKIRVADISFEKDINGIWTIYRYTGQYGGKMTTQPEIKVTAGKAKRTVEEQVELQFNAKVKEYLDKGYKELEKELDDYDESELNDIIGENKTDANGFQKHMLAKQSEKVSDKTINSKAYWWASRKIDGVRCSFYWDGEEVKSASRGGGEYDISTEHIRKHPKFVEFFKTHPKIVLDGELYKHGKSLQQISGAARREIANADGCWLEYYIYDVMAPEPFEDRLNTLKEIELLLGLDFDPNREWSSTDLRVQMVPQEKVSGKAGIIALHNKYVSEGWEGCVVRDPKGTYKYGGRGSEMVKFKKYRDDCFKVVGIEQGLRPIDDMVFILETSDGKQFKAKPFGDHNIKEEYCTNFEEKYKNHIGECKFFYYSDDGTPLQPSFKAFRYDLE